MRLFSVLAFVLMTITFTPLHSAECIKTFDYKKKTAFEGEACASQALNDADRDLATAYERLNRATNFFGTHSLAQEYWLDERNRCVRSGKEEDCISMIRVRAAFYEFQAGSESGEHRMIWFGMTSTPFGPGGNKMQRIFYHFLKPATPGEKFFNEVIQQEYRKSAESYFLAQKRRSSYRRCFDWVILGTATLTSGVIRVPIQSFLGCSDPKATETTSFISVDLDHAKMAQ